MLPFNAKVPCKTTVHETLDLVSQQRPADGDRGRPDEGEGRGPAGRGGMLSARSAFCVFETPLDGSRARLYVAVKQCSAMSNVLQAEPVSSRGACRMAAAP